MPVILTGERLRVDGLRNQYTKAVESNVTQIWELTGVAAKDYRGLFGKNFELHMQRRGRTRTEMWFTEKEVRDQLYTLLNAAMG